MLLSKGLKRLKEHFNENIKELFALCGIEIKENVALKKDRDRYRYWDVQCVRAIEMMKKRNQKEKGLQDEVDRLLAEKADLEEKLKKETSSEQAFEKMKLELKKQETEWEERLSKAEKEQKECCMEIEALQEEYKSQIRRLIEMRDTLFMREAWIEDNAPEEVAAKKLVKTQLKEVARILENAGVEISEGNGIYCPEVHTVVGTIPAKGQEEIGYIAQTVRSGYRFRGENLRSQEVMIYVEGEK